MFGQLHPFEVDVILNILDMLDGAKDAQAGETDSEEASKSRISTPPITDADRSKPLSLPFNTEQDRDRVIGFLEPGGEHDPKSRGRALEAMCLALVLVEDLQGGWSVDWLQQMFMAIYGPLEPYFGIGLNSVVASRG